MKYDFTTQPDRSRTGSTKWEEMYAACDQVPKGTVPLSVADMEFFNAPEITEGLKKFLDGRVLGYTKPTDAYYDAVISWMQRRKNWEISREEIVCSPGVIPTLYSAVRAFSEPGDGVVLLTPAYPPFYAAVRSNGRRAIECPLIDHDGVYEINFEEVEEKSRPESVKLLILCNPHNPTGRSWRREELERLGEICQKNHLKVIADEIHSDLIMPGITHTVFASLAPELDDITISCTAPSKTFNLAGMQTSNIVIRNPRMREKFRAELNLSMGGNLLNIMGYEACRIAYTECEAWLNELISVIWDNHQYVKSFARERMPHVVVSPLEGTYLQWLDFRAYGLTPQQLAEKNQKEAHAFLDEGSIFGPEGEGFERVNLACPRKTLEGVMERLAGAYEFHQ